MISEQVINDLAEVRQLMLHMTKFKTTEKGWTAQEQVCFWDALRKFPEGPWTAIASCIGTKSTRQTMTHAQKLRHKLWRWRRRCNASPRSSASSAGSVEQSPRHLIQGGQRAPMVTSDSSDLVDLSELERLADSIMCEDGLFEPVELTRKAEDIGLAVNQAGEGMQSPSPHEWHALCDISQVKTTFATESQHRHELMPAPLVLEVVPVQEEQQHDYRLSMSMLDDLLDDLFGGRGVLRLHPNCHERTYLLASCRA